MAKILFIGNSGLNSDNNSTSIRMKEIIEELSINYFHEIDYYKLRKATLVKPYLNYINPEENANIWFAIKSICKEHKKYDLIIGESFKGAIIAYIISNLQSTKFIWRQFGSTFNDELKSSFLRPKTLFKFFFHKIIINSRHLSAVICTEDGCANRALYINRLNLNENKFFLVKNQRTEFIDIVKKEPKQTVISVIGRIVRWKKIHLLIESIILAKKQNRSFAENFLLQIIGVPSEIEYELALKDLIKSSRLENQVVFYKNLNLEEISLKISESTFVVSLTAYNPIIESLQNKTPVITYNYGEVNEIFESNPAVVIIGKSIRKSSGLNKKEEETIIQELAEQIINYHINKKRLLNVGEEGQKKLVSQFPTLKEHVTQVCEIYNCVLTSNLK